VIYKDLSIKNFNESDYNNELDALHSISYNFLVLVFEQPARGDDSSGGGP
jgi:hypothetical protein